MAVVKKQGEYTETVEITLEDKQPLTVTVRRGGMDEGRLREIAEHAQELTAIGERIEHLRSLAVKASSDREYEENLKKAKSFTARKADVKKVLERMTDAALLKTVTGWTLYLSEEEEKEGRAVPVTEDGLAQLDFDLKWDIQNKLNEALLVKDPKKSSGN